MEKSLYFPTKLQVGDLVTFTNGDIAKVLEYKPSFKEGLFDIKIKFISNNKITWINSSMIKEKSLREFTISKVILECIKIGTQENPYEVRDVFTDGVLYKGHTISYEGRKYVKTDDKGGKWYIN